MTTMEEEKNNDKEVQTRSPEEPRPLLDRMAHCSATRWTTARRRRRRRRCGEIKEEKKELFMFCQVRRVFEREDMNIYAC